ncbi:hypothetical protein [Streptomyces sp. TRM49041]|uniref:hypothetical protein n=1 Tax=Streptomyces sp. TRM49041 TaxID=2603216 RepID=UPI0011ED78C3|nr:hypothetical protein [Streptomyces sp. TRM49041]
MSVRLKSSTVDGRLQEVFGAPVVELYTTATGPDAPPALTRALELRSFLALAEEQVARVRDRVHEAMAPDRDMGELSAADLRFDAQWLEAALDARDGYRAALGELLRTMPPPDHQPRPVRTAQPVVAAVLPPSLAAPAPARAGAARARRP